MSLWRELTRGLRTLTHRATADRDVADEVEHYRDQAVAAHIARGLSAAEARRAAHLELGNLTVAREEVRSYGWENVVESVLGDLRYAARRLRRTPGFSVVCVLTLALGIGASTAIFSAVNPILFEPLPYPGANRIMTIWDAGSDRAQLEVTYGTFRELAARSRAFDAFAVMKSWQPTVTGAAEPERLDGQRISASYFTVLGVRPALGRDFRVDDDRPTGPRVVILSDGLWRRRFGGDSAIVGRAITLDDDQYSVIGVMPRGFENVLAPSAEVWSPLQYDMSIGPAWGHHLRMVGRAHAGIDPSAAARDLDVIARTVVKEFARPPWAAIKNGMIVRSLQDDVTRAARPALLAVLGAVVLVLLSACVNVTNLLLARGAQRRGELALRAALGAARIRLVGQLLIESLLISLLGGALGVAFAQAGVRALLVLSPPGLPRANAIGLDARAYAFALAVTALVGITVGLVPALQASRGAARRGVNALSRQSTGRYRATRATLVIAEVALALVLLVGSGLLLRSVRHLFAIAPGFEPYGLLTMQVQVAGHRFDSAGATHRFFEQALDAARRVPGVSAAAFTSQLPLSGDYDIYGAHFESGKPGEGYGVFRYAVSPGYLETLGIPLRRGRLLDAREVAGAPPAVLINESFARRRFPNQDVIGQRVRIGPNEGPWATVVGVVGDVKQTSLEVTQADAVYMTTAQWRFPDNALTLVVRSRGNVASLAPAVRNAIWSVDRNQPVVRIATMEQLVAASAAARRFALIVFEAFGLVALALAATGIYGVLAGSVTERAREIGVRSALGASRGRIVGLVLGQGLRLTGIGIVVGLAGAAAASRAVVTLLFGVSRLDPVTYGGVIALLACVSALACAIPAWRAARIDPTVTLRSD